MKRQLAGLSQASLSTSDIPDGEYLVRVAHAFYRRHKTKPFYLIRFEVFEPAAFRDQTFDSRMYCNVKALWKLNWFLRDFGYDADLLGRDELDENALAGLQGVVRIVHKIRDGHPILSLEGFAPSERWTQLSHTGLINQGAA